MLALLIGTFVMLCHVVIGMLVPGFVLDHGLSRFRSRSSDAMSGLTRAMGYGTLWVTVQWLMLYASTTVFCLPPVPIILILVTINLLLTTTFVLGRFQKRGFPSEMFCLVKLQGCDYALIAAAIFLGCFAIVFYPHALDNSALGWTNYYVQKPRVLLINSEGAPGYIGLLALPGTLLKGWVPLPTLAAGLKLPLALLIAYVIRRLVNRFQFGKYRSAAALLAFLLLPTLFFGKYGMLQTGKESVFAVTFLFLFAAELMSGRRNAVGYNLQCGLALTAAVGFGAIAIPYAAVLYTAVIWFEFCSATKRRWTPFAAIRTLVLVTALPVVISLHAMLLWPWWKSGLLVAALLIGSQLLSSISVPRLPSFAPIARWAPVVTPGIVFGALAMLMPVRYGPGFFPLDGEATVWDVIKANETVGWLGLAGAVALVIAKFFGSGIGNRSQKSAAINALIVMPWAALLVPLTLANLPNVDPIVHPSKIWDLAKDVPNWILAPYSSLFCVYALVRIARALDRIRIRRLNRRVDQLSGRQPSQRAGRSYGAHGWLIMSVVVVAALADGRSLFRRIVLPSFNTIGGHRDAALIQVAELHCDSLRGPQSQHIRRAFVDSESDFLEQRHSLGMYGPAVEEINFQDQAAVARLMKANRSPFLLVVAKENLADLPSRLEALATLKFKTPLADSDDQLFVGTPLPQ